jgi:hypothetical protein
MVGIRCLLRGNTILACASIALFGSFGCSLSGQAYLNHYTHHRPQSYLVIAPQGRAKLDCVAQFLEAKRQEGLRVSVLEFSLDLPMPDRLPEVARLIEQNRPPEGELAYALIIASEAELPMSSAEIGKGAAARSDLPLYLPVPKGSRHDSQHDRWRTMSAPNFPWVFGRLPFDDPATLAASFRASAAYATRSNEKPRFALLGAERIGRPSDSALVLTLARKRFIAHRWHSELYATDKPNDKQLDPKLAFFDLTFLDRWQSDSPAIVYTLSHSGNECGEYHTKTITGQGRHLLSPLGLITIQDIQKPSAPQSPAVFVSSACGLGYPENGLIDLLFDKGWIAAMITSTQSTYSTPLLPAVNAEINIAECIASGLPIGLALRATQRAYYDEAFILGDLLMPDEQKQKIATNLVGYTIYGDPSLCLSADPVTGRE